MVNLSLEHGNSDGSCVAYLGLAMIAGPLFGNYSSTAMRFVSSAMTWSSSVD